MMDLHSFVFKCAHALLKSTMEGFFFTPPSQPPSLLVQLISQLSRVVITEVPRALFSGACQIISTASMSNASQPNSFLLSLSHHCRAPRVSGVLFQPVVWQLRLALAAEPARPPSLPSPHMSVCVCPCWGHSRRTVGVTRSQTALNGPKQAAQINNLLRLQSSHQEQHSVKCQQQTP